MALNVAIGSSVDIRLAYALLLYASANNDHAPADALAYATIHPVAVDSDNRARIEPGRPAAADELIDIFRALTNAGDDLPILPEHILAHGLRATCWYRPARPAILWFSEKLEQLHPFSGRQFLQPTLVFAVSGQRLTVRVVKGTGRPIATTPLYKAPYFNISPDGLVCMGNARQPRTHAASATVAWETAFFDSRFTHLNDVPKALTKHPQGLGGYWRAHLRSARRRNSDLLVSAKETLATMLKRIHARQ